jgi:hypothetical protein
MDVCFSISDTHLLAVAVHRVEWRLQRSVLVVDGALRLAAVAWQAPAALVLAPALHAPMQDEGSREVGGDGDSLLVASDRHLHRH